MARLIDDKSMMPEIIDNGEVYQQNEELLIVLKREGRMYRVAPKTTITRDRNYLLSLFATSDHAAYAEVVRKYERIR